MRHIEIFDTTCRDGEQATKGFKEGIESKIIIAKKLQDLGVDTIEAGFPKSSDNNFQAVQMIARQVHGPYICALARCLESDIDPAWEAVKDNEKPTIHVFTFMVDPKSLQAYGINEFNEIIKQSVHGVAYAKELMKGKGRVEFSAQNAVLGDKDRMYQLYSEVIAAGADVVNLPDTAGYSLPDEIFYFVTNFKKNAIGASNVIISTHCHNDLGNAVANSIAAVMAGARQVECTINGIGERAGNAALEEVVMNIRTRKDKLKAHTNIQTKSLGELSKIVSEHSGLVVQPNKSIVGSNAFKHDSGIHQDGVLKGAGYEIIKPEEVGWDGESIEITSGSGKKGYMHRLETLGYNPKTLAYYIDQIVANGKRLTDELKHELNDLDLRVIADSILRPVKETIVYKRMQLKKEDGVYTTEVEFEIDGEYITKKSSHKGAIDALFSAVDSSVKTKMPKLVIYEPRNIGKDHSATAEVTVVLSSNGFNGDYNLHEPLFIGRARHQDTLEASIKAYVNAINQYIANQQI